MKNSEMIGNTYNRWTVVDTSNEKNKNGNRLCLARCECGTERLVIASSLRTGKSKSCGCIAVEKTSKRNLSHGKSKHPLYGRWNAMIKRCHLESDSRYMFYGARGIEVCPAWRNDPAEFYNWYEKQGGDLSLTVDRIDTFGNYAPDNCRLITMEEQQQNRRPEKGALSNKKILEIKTLLRKEIGTTEISRITGVSRGIIQNIKSGKTYKKVE